CPLCMGRTTKGATAAGAPREGAGGSAPVHRGHTLKPLDREATAGTLRSYPHVVVIEECAPNGSLSMQVRALASTIGATCRLDTFTLKDAFIHCYGTHDDILDAHGLATDEICGRLTLH